jgi:post-segregation antitoxin (ccd killing protein)
MRERTMAEKENKGRQLTRQQSREERATGWAIDNAPAIQERRSWIEATGVPLADLQVLRLD